jgi:hypothetical protein
MKISVNITTTHISRLMTGSSGTGSQRWRKRVHIFWWARNFSDEHVTFSATQYFLFILSSYARFSDTAVFLFAILCIFFHNAIPFGFTEPKTACPSGSFSSVVKIPYLFPLMMCTQTSPIYTFDRDNLAPHANTSSTSTPQSSGGLSTQSQVSGCETNFLSYPRPIQVPPNRHVHRVINVASNLYIQSL